MPIYLTKPAERLFIKPYYENNFVQIFHGDCREILPSIPPVDAVLFDPPYCSGGFNEAGRSTAKSQGVRDETLKHLGWFSGDNMTSMGACFLLSGVASLCKKKLAKTGTFTFFTDWRMVPILAPAIESYGFRWQAMIVWKKPSIGMGAGFRPQHELVLHFTNGSPIYFAKNGSNVIDSSRVGVNEREHPTQKPVALMGEIIRVVSPEGGLILDPFMGSGSTLVAAMGLGRKAIGIDLDERFCEIAARRMQQGILPL